MSISINPDDFVSWLVTQKNKTGSLYLERVAKAYANYLRTAPLKLNIRLKPKQRDVYACKSVDEFLKLKQIFMSAPNYIEVNQIGHRTFHSGMVCFEKYLNSSLCPQERGDGNPVAVVVPEKITKTENKVDFSNPEKCAFTDPLECRIAGKAVRGVNWNWRDLLVAVTEHFIRTNESSVKSFALNGGRLLITKNKPASAVCRQLSNRYFITVSYDIPMLVRIIGRLCSHCGVNLDDLTITYTIKEKHSVKVTADSSTSARYTESDVRSGFKKWLIERNKANPYYCDAYFLYNNDLGLPLYDALNLPDGEQLAYNAFEKYFTEHRTKQLPATRARGYRRALKLFKQYLSENRSDLLNTVTVPDISTVNPETTTSNENTIAVSPLPDIVDYEDGRAGLKDILETHFKMLYGYTHLNLVWEAAQSQLFMFLNDNGINDKASLWRFMDYAFENEYYLYNCHIWCTEPDYPKNSRGLIINLSEQNRSCVSREEIDRFFSKVKLTSPNNYEVIKTNEIIFCDKADFIPVKSLNLSDDLTVEIKNALTMLFKTEKVEYIVLRDIREDWYSRLPELPYNLPWTPLLLQEILRVTPDIGFRTIMPGLKQALDAVATAIVPTNSDITTFADVIHRYAYAKYKLPYNISAEDFRLQLREAGMLEGNELIYIMHKALNDHRFAFDNEKQTIKILER
jgi:hypothetical protein